MPPKTVLVIDDNPDNAVLIRILLECEGMVVRTAEDALQALEVLKTWHPALVLMDIQLPGIDGLELTRRLRLNPAYRNMKIVALSAYAMKKDEEEARQAGCDAYITKPIDTRAFGRLVQRHLGMCEEISAPPGLTNPEIHQAAEAPARLEKEPRSSLSRAAAVGGAKA